jgi:hypothetical protein
MKIGALLNDVNILPCLRRVHIVGRREIQSEKEDNRGSGRGTSSRLRDYVKWPR